jgi:fatty acid desaturase
MALSEEHLRSAVDEVLEPAWPRERRRAARRLGLRTTIRIVWGCLALWVLGFVVHLWVGVSFPWVFFGVIALLASVAASGQEDHVHLRRH